MQTIKKIPAPIRTAIVQYFQLSEQRKALALKLEACEAVFGNEAAREKATGSVKKVLVTLATPLATLDQELQQQHWTMRKLVRAHFRQHGLSVGAHVRMQTRKLTHFAIDDNLTVTNEDFELVEPEFRVEGFQVLRADHRDSVTLGVVGRTLSKNGRVTKNEHTYTIDAGLSVTVLRPAPADSLREAA